MAVACDMPPRQRIKRREEKKKQEEKIREDLSA